MRKSCEEVESFFGRLSVAHRIDGGHRHGSGVEVGLHPVGARKADKHKASDQQQRQGTSELCGHGKVAQAEAAMAGKLHGWPFFQRGRQFRSRDAQGGRHAESDPADKRRDEGKYGGAPVNAQFWQTWCVNGLIHLCVQHVKHVGQAEAQQAAEQRKQQSFAHQLARKAEAAGAN